MSNLMPTDLEHDVREVLLHAPDAGPVYGRGFLTAYQILDRLPQPVRDRLVAERGQGGGGSGSSTAPSVVADAAKRLPGVEVMALDVRGLVLQLHGVTIVPAAEVVVIYRLRKEHLSEV